MNECPVHDKDLIGLACTCSPERKWVRNKMLQENLKALIGGDDE